MGIVVGISVGKPQIFHFIISVRVRAACVRKIKGIFESGDTFHIALSNPSPSSEPFHSLTTTYQHTILNSQNKSKPT